MLVVHIGPLRQGLSIDNPLIGLVEGRRQGAAIGAAAATVVITGAAFVYRKFKASSFTKRDQELPAEDSNLVVEEGVSNEHDANEGATSA